MAEVVYELSLEVGKSQKSLEVIDGERFGTISDSIYLIRLHESPLLLIM